MNISEKDTVLTLGFTAGTLFDMKEAETIFEQNTEEDREGLYRKYFEKMNKEGQVFKPGPALGLYISLHRLRKQIPTNIIQLRFGLSSRFDTAHEGAVTLFNSLDHYLFNDNEDFMPDYISLTGGLEQASPHKMQGADIVFTSSDSSAKIYHNNGMASTEIPNISELQNMKMFQNRNNTINFIFDFDGVVVDHTSEMVYQAAKKVDGMVPLEAFRLNEIANRNKPMELGPLGCFLQKSSLIVAYYQKKMLANEIKAKDIPFETRILTARGGAATFRIVKTLTHYGIQVSRADFADGRPKHLALSMLDENNINLFLEDSRVHVDGARKNVNHIMAGLVFNDYTSGKATLDETIEKLTIASKV